MRYALVILMFFQIACNDNPPETKLDPQHGKRDYTWAVDTLWFTGAEQIIGTDVWYSSPNSVLVSAITNVGLGSLWHFDGTAWTNPPNPADASDGRGAVDLNGAFGISSSSVWFVGFRIRSFGPGQTVTSGFVMEWNGSGFVEHTDTLISKGKELMAVWGSSRERLYVAGMDGTFLRFDGSRWHKIDTGTKAWLNALWGITDNNILLLGYELDMTQPFDSTFYSVFSWDGSQFSTLATHLETEGSPAHPWGVYSLWSDNTKFYTADYSLFVGTGTIWNKLLDNPFALRAIRGSGPHDVFAVGSRNSILHFNGIDWLQMSPISDSYVHWNSVYATGHEVFAVGENGPKTIVFRGK